MQPMTNNSALSRFLFDAFLKFQQGTGKRETISTFAEHISRSAGHPLQRATLAMWMDGKRTPTGDWVPILAATPEIGPEVYDVLGLQRPDPELQYLIKSWNKLPGPIRKSILKTVRKSDVGLGEALAKPVEK